MMFTGLIREFATVENYIDNTLTVKADYTPEIGDSIAINGACLTVISIDCSLFSVELSKESRDVLAIENYANKVHMEPAMQFGDRIEGHMVQGHVDCIGTIASISKSENAWDFDINVPKDFMKFMMPKGSIAIDGVSLTINELKKESVRLTIISHTMKNTLFSSYKVGQRVNIETDMFARYIHNMLHQDDTKTSWDTIDHITALY